MEPPESDGVVGVELLDDWALLFEAELVDVEL